MIILLAYSLFLMLFVSQLPEGTESSIISSSKHEFMDDVDSDANTVKHYSHDRVHHTFDRGEFITSHLKPWKKNKRKAESHSLESSGRNLNLIPVSFTKSLSTRLPGYATEVYDTKHVVAIKALYSSGSGWLRTLISLNCEGVTHFHPSQEHADIDSDGIYGWKHGYPVKSEIDRMKKSESKHKIIFLTRNPFTWLAAVLKFFDQLEFFGTSYLGHVRHSTDPSMQLQNFTKTPIRFPCPLFSFMRLYYGHCSQPWFTQDNILQWRRSMLSSWREASEENGNLVTIVRYEDLVSQDAESSYLDSKLSEVFPEERNDLCKRKLEKINSHVKYGQESDSKFSSKKYHEKVCAAFVDETIYQLVRKNLDEELESSLGYSIPSSLTELRDFFDCDKLE